jgi:hypothetical protein
MHVLPSRAPFKVRQMIIPWRHSDFLKGIFFSFYVRYSTRLHLPPLRFHCEGGDAGIELRTVATLALTARRSNHSASFVTEVSETTGIRIGFYLSFWLGNIHKEDSILASVLADPYFFLSRISDPGSRIPALTTTKIGGKQKLIILPLMWR